MPRFVAGYNRLPDGRCIWLVQADEDAGWNWDNLLGQPRWTGFEWGGDEWVRSAPSRKRIREEFRKGDIVVCYQAKPLRSVVGLARVASGGYEPHRGKRRTPGTTFDMDWGCRVTPVSSSTMMDHPVLGAMEKMRIRQGTVFRVSPAEFTALLGKMLPVDCAVEDVERRLKIAWPHDAPTFDEDELSRRVRKLLAGGDIPRPTGIKKPRVVERNGVASYERDPRVKAFVLQQARGTCELCASSAPFVCVDGTPFLEVHHVRQLALRGPDTPENSVAVCPNCHRRLHLGVDAGALVEKLYAGVARLVRC